MNVLYDDDVLYNMLYDELKYDITPAPALYSGLAAVHDCSGVSGTGDTVNT